jgi:hypothetical protein
VDRERFFVVIANERRQIATLVDGLDDTQLATPSVGGRFATVAAGDPVAAASAILGEPDSVRQGWVDTATLAAELGKLAPLVCAAAELCGLAIFDDT